MDIKEKLQLIPKAPGCYQYLNAAGEIIYIGKAKNLFNRVNSYFTGKHDPKTSRLVDEIDAIEYIVTNSEVEAFILEINLIKKNNPKYNIKLTDDKTYPYIVLTDDPHPRLIYTRNKNKGKIFGPFPCAKAAKDTVEVLNRIYPLRKCRVIPKKPCLYYHLGECLAPCINKINPDIYKDIKAKITSFLKGNIKDVSKMLAAEMDNAAKNLNFEKAAAFRDLIKSLNVTSEKQTMEGLKDNLDAFSYYFLNGDISIQVFHLRQGKMLARDGYLFKTENPVEFFTEFVAQFYLLFNNPLPKIIFISDGDVEFLKTVLKTNVRIPKIGKNWEFINLVKTNAEEKITELIKKRELEYQKTTQVMRDLEKMLGIEKISRVEAFDNSNISGASAVASMVCFVDGKADKKSYRKFRIKTVTGANDVADMEEVIFRRYSKDGINPDLVIVDGGKAQVTAAQAGLKRAGKKLPVMGLVKDMRHQTDAVFYKDEKTVLDRRSYLYKFLARVQDEAHRFAISFFHATHSKQQTASKLDLIPGIGEVRKKMILKILGEPDFQERLANLPLTPLQKEKVWEIFKPER